MTKRSLKGEIRAVLALGLLSVTAAPAAYGQQAAEQQTTAAASQQTTLQEVVITGSRIRRQEGQAGTVAITSVGTEQLVEQGDINIGDALNDLPALRSTFSQGNSTRFIGTAGLNLLDLRGLGIERTLVLVNNRRHVSASPGDYLVDVNTIPSDLIERVDVVTGGNSAIYGSDAVAGVVNFITRRDFEGFKVRVQGGQSSRSDRDTDFASVVFGRNFSESRGNVAVAVEWGQSDALFFNERDGLTGAFTGRHQFNAAENTADDGPTGSDGIFDNEFFDGGIFNANVADGGVASVLASGNPASSVFCGNLPEPTRSQRCLPNNQPRIFSFDRNGNLVETVPGTDFRPFGSGNVQISDNPGELSSLRNTGQLAAGLERYSVNLYAHYDVTDAFRPFVEAKFVDIDAIQEGQPSFWVGSIPGFFGGGANLSCSNPFLSAQALATLQTLGRCATPTSAFFISRFNVDFGGRGELHDRDTFRIVAGAEGAFNDDWHYEVAVNYGRLDTKLRSLNNLVLFDVDGNEDGFLLALNAVRNAQGQIVCGVNADADPSNDRPDCVPINVFGVGAPSQEALDFVNTNARRNEEAEQFVASAFVSGDLSQLFELPGGPVGFALGVEYRSEKAESIFDELTASGGTFLNAIQPFTPPKLTVKDVFGELRIPLVSDVPMVHELTIEGAGRLSDYNTETDSVSAYNGGLIWAPVRDIRFRGNYSKSVRAPTQSDLFSPQSQNFAFIQDPCDILFINANPNRAANCAADGVPANFVNLPARTFSTSFLQGGNPTLVEEEGRSYTIGALFTPRFLPGFAFSVDYYRIKVKELIATLGAQAILNECYNSPSGINNSFCATVNRNPDGTFADPAVIAGGVNFASQITKGIDFDVSYRTTFANGHRLNARGIATRVTKLNNFTNPSDPDFANRQLSELGDPKLAFNINLGYGIGDFDLSYSLRYLGKQTIGFYEEQHSFQGNPPTNEDRFPRVFFPTRTYHDVRLEYAATENLTVFGGVDNLSDELPPLGQLGVAGGDPFDSIGRYFYFGMKIDL